MVESMVRTSPPGNRRWSTSPGSGATASVSLLRHCLGIVAANEHAVRCATTAINLMWIMSAVGDLLRFETADGWVLVEERSGDDLEQVGLLDRVRRARQPLDKALAQIRPAALAAFESVKDLPTPPDVIEVEIGVTLTAEAGAIIARTTAEGHVVLRLTWTGKNSDGDNRAS